MSDEHERLLALMPRRTEDYDPWGSNVRWADAEKAYPDCSCGCIFAKWLEGGLGADWCVCTNPKSHRCGLLTFEHQGCQQCEQAHNDDDDEFAEAEYVPSRRMRLIEKRLSELEKRDSDAAATTPQPPQGEVCFFDDKLVRIVIRNGEPWFVARDVCEAIGIQKPDNAYDRLDHSDRGTCLVGPQEMVIISESGMYDLVVSSDSPEAKSFRHWVTHDVLEVLKPLEGHG